MGGAYGWRCSTAALAALPSARAWTLDVTDPAAMRAAVEELLAAWGRVDILVNCADITGRTNLKSHEVELADFDQVLNVNLRGSLIAFQAVIPHMPACGYGRILHIASISGKEGNAGMLAYSTSKAAVIGMTANPATLRRYLVSVEIRVRDRVLYQTPAL